MLLDAASRTDSSAAVARLRSLPRSVALRSSCATSPCLGDQGGRILPQDLVVVAPLPSFFLSFVLAPLPSPLRPCVAMQCICIDLAWIAEPAVYSAATRKAAVDERAAALLRQLPRVVASTARPSTAPTRARADFLHRPRSTTAHPLHPSSDRTSPWATFHRRLSSSFDKQRPAPTSRAQPGLASRPCKLGLGLLARTHLHLGPRPLARLPPLPPRRHQPSRRHRLARLDRRNHVHRRHHDRRQRLRSRRAVPRAELDLPRGRRRAAPPGRPHLASGRYCASLSTRLVCARPEADSRLLCTARSAAGPMSKPRRP